MADDSLPYRHLSSSLLSVMPAHVVYPQVDARPAGYSRIWLQDVLRTQMGFTGAIFSDDLSMEGGRYLDGTLLSYAQAACAALQAGCDLVLLCNQSIVNHGAEIDQFLQDMTIAVKLGRWHADSRSEARRLALLPQQPALDWDALHATAAWQEAQRLLDSLLA